MAEKENHQPDESGRYDGLNVSPLKLPVDFFEKFPVHKNEEPTGLRGLQQLFIDVTLFEVEKARNASL